MEGCGDRGSVRQPRPRVPASEEERGKGPHAYRLCLSVRIWTSGLSHGRLPCNEIVAIVSHALSSSRSHHGSTETVKPSEVEVSTSRAHVEADKDLSPESCARISSPMRRPDARCYFHSTLHVSLPLRNGITSTDPSSLRSELSISTSDLLSTILSLRSSLTL